MSSGLNFAVVIKGEERYTFVYSDDSADEVLETCKRFAEDPMLSFDAKDAVLVTLRVQSLEQQARLEGR